ncbi:MAG TPA: hypothetical protein PKC19_03235 [Roseiflexaceae bacterium]|nr:hypothetical protein [Roseiflexaceae bacterium]
MALILPVLMALLMTGMAVGERYLEVAQAEDALRQAARSAVQSFAYQQFAEDSIGIDEGRAYEIAQRTLLANLVHVHGLAEHAEAAAARVVWNVLPAGGTCDFGGRRAAVQAIGPLICASWRPSFVGVVGYGIWEVQIDVAEQLD